MRAAAFDYHVPKSLDEAVSLLARYGPDGRLLAGGQSLVPAMTARLARPAQVIDINRIRHLRGLSLAGDGVSVPALARHADFEAHGAQNPLAVLLSRLASSMGPLPVRTRGTFCGAVANADPAAEWCLLCVALGATIVLRSEARGVREVSAANFFRSVEMTDADDDEMVVSARLPGLPPWVQWGFSKVSRTTVGFGEALALCIAEVEGGKLTSPRIALGGVEAVPRRLGAAERILAGNAPSRTVAREAAATVARDVEPLTGDGAPGNFRRRLAATAVERAILDAIER
ncbi:MAG: FAD binding domain-containing protein [Pseudomonadota bacterium]